jgi:hypothetical protein
MGEHLPAQNEIEHLERAVRFYPVLALLLATALGSNAGAASWLAAQDAAAHIGETATVCGTVASTNYAVKSKGQPTYLNLDRPYPNQAFTNLIWGSDRPKFGTPETAFMGKKVCATGTIKDYRGKPEIIATDPKQIVPQ